MKPSRYLVSLIWGAVLWCLLVAAVLHSANFTTIRIGYP